MLDRIAGFKQYLSITERERLDRMHPPKDTPELFERYLPYAIALGVENRWADRFAGVLAAAAAPGRSQGFAWYSGISSPWNDPGGFVDYDRLVARQHGQLGLDRSRLEQRLGRRRIVGRRRRRRRRRRLVAQPRPAAAERRVGSPVIDRLVQALEAEPFAPASSTARLPGR